MATRTDTRSPAVHVADSHDLIRVQGARVNNLKDVSVELPKRRLTVFTGVSGSGKSSLVFGTIAAESQRLINETYSAFVQGFMPTQSRPEVDLLEGLTTAIIVDQERIGLQPPLHRRHRHRRERDAADRLQPARKAAHRIAQGVLLQRPVGHGRRRDHGRARFPEDGEEDLQRHRRHVPAVRGHGQRDRPRPGPALRREQVPRPRVRSPSPATPGAAGTRGSSPSRASSTRTSRSATTPRPSCTTSSTASRPG